MNNAKEFFSNIRDNDLRIKALMERKEDYYHMALSGGSLREVRTNSPHGSSVEAATEKIVDDIAAKIDEEIAMLMNELRQANRLISRIKNRKQQDVLRFRYLNGWSWEKISRAMQYNRRWIYQLHREALDECDRLMQQNNKEVQL